MKKCWKIAGSALLMGGAGVLVAACTTPTTSTLRGQVASETFASPPSDVVVISSHGDRKVAPLPADGSFALVLIKGRSYQIAFQTNEGLVPLVLAGAHGRYATELEVDTGGAEANLGLVRYFANQAAGEPGQRALKFPPLAPLPGECVDGYFGTGGEPCMNGEAQITCSEDGDDDSDSDSDGDSDSDSDGDSDDDAEWGYDGEQEGEWNDDVGGFGEVAGPVAVPEHSLSEGLECDDDDSDSDSD